MRYLLKILVLHLFIVPQLFSQWEEQKTGFTENLNEICFTDSLNGFAYGQSLVIHTTDGGINWNQQNFPSTQNSYISAYTGMTVFNKNIAIITGDSAFVYYTTNGGENWLASNTGYPYTYSFSNYLNDSTIYITGTIFNVDYGGGLILKSVNYGATWEKIYQTKFGFDPIPYWIDDLFFTSNDTGYAIFHISFDNFGPNDFMKTTDGGKSWLKISETPQMVLDLEQKDNVFWARAFGFNYSIDYGLHWSMGNIANWAILGMKIITGNYGLFLIVEKSGDLPKLRFANPGTNFTKDVSLPYGFIANSFSYVNERNIWLAGKDGKIYKYNSTITSVNEDHKEYQYNLSQNYPNPFNPTTNIEFRISDFGFVTLKVYDILGKEIATLVNEEKPAGSYSVSFSAESFGNFSKPSSGIYFYVLNAGGNVLCRKMCLLK